MIDRSTARPLVFLGVVLAVLGGAPPASASSKGPVNIAVAIRSVEGTEWSMPGEGPGQMNITYRFERGGVLVYRYNGQTYRNGTWKQDGNRLTFECNKKYRECRASVRGDRIEGDSWNVAGARWQTSLARDRGTP
jgi:hypothetical protein